MKGNISLVLSAACVTLGIVFMVMDAYQGKAMFPAGIMMFVSMIAFLANLGKQNAKNLITEEDV